MVRPPAITPDQAGAVAVARLRLPTPTPGIGPSPELNEWKMAAVGYPLWLWAEGTTHLGPVTDSVAGLTVSLDAHLTSVAFAMGDGHTARCVGAGRRWTPAVEAGAESPTCGYRYAKPSMPAGRYRVVATSDWSVRWRANGSTGVIVVPTTSSVELPVGELQVLVH